MKRTYITENEVEVQIEGVDLPSTILLRSEGEEWHEARAKQHRWLIEEKAEYTVEAGSEAEALEEFATNGPEISVDGRVQFIGVSDRQVTPAAD